MIHGSDKRKSSNQEVANYTNQGKIASAWALESSDRNSDSVTLKQRASLSNFVNQGWCTVIAYLFSSGRARESDVTVKTTSIAWTKAMFISCGRRSEDLIVLVGGKFDSSLGWIQNVKHSLKICPSYTLHFHVFRIRGFLVEMFHRNAMSFFDSVILKERLSRIRKRHQSGAPSALAASYYHSRVGRDDKTMRQHRDQRGRI